MTKPSPIKKNLLYALLAFCALWLTLPTQAVTLVNEWKFENNADDTSGNGNNGTISGSPAPNYVAGVFGGQAIYLNRANVVQKTAAVGLPFAGTDSMSENVWLYLTNAPDSLAMFCGFGATVTAAGQSRSLLGFGTAPYANGIYHWGNSRDLSAQTAFPLDQWIMVTITHDAATSTRTIWLNGTQIATATGGTYTLSDIIAANRKVTVGASSPWSATKRWNGVMDEFTIWNGVLSTNAIAGLYASNSISPATPSIDGVPRSGTARVGEKFPLPVVVSGYPEPFSYRWWKNGTNAIADATNSTLVLNVTSTNDAGDYTVVVSNVAGSITSSPPATVTVLDVTNVVTDLAAYWNFNETSGTNLADVTGNGNDADLNNFPTDNSQWVPGMFGKALNFRGPGAGLNDYVRVTNNHINPPRGITVSAWVWVDSISQWASIIKNWPGLTPSAPAYTNSLIHLGMENTANQLSCYTFNPVTGQQVGPVSEGASFRMGQWVHVAYVCDGEKMRLYRNGAAIGTPLAYGGWLNTNTLSNTLGIGVKIGTNGLPTGDAAVGYWKGKMDDIGIWNRGLRPNELLAIYIAGKIAGQPLTGADPYTNVALPYITDQPHAVTKYQNEYGAQFQVLAVGAGDLSYQWRENGTNMPSATNSILNLVGPFTTSATYDALITDTRPGSSSTVTSAPAALTIQAVAGPATALAGYWKFDETSGTTAADSTASARNATLNNFSGDSTTWVSGQIGGALAFGGPASAQYAIVNNYVQATNNTLTLSAWVRADALNGSDAVVDTFGQTVVPPGGQYRLGMSSSSALAGSVAAQAANGVSATEATGFPTGSWQHVAVVADGATIRLYRSGAQVATNAYNGTIQIATLVTNMLIGARIADDGVSPNPTNACLWTGKMDDLGIWTRGLSPRDVFGIYAAGRAAQPLTNYDAYTNSGPIITAQPQNESIYIHEPFWPALRVGVSYFDTLSYQWWKDGAMIANATNSTYSKSGTVDFPDAGNYSVVVTGGGTSLTSAPAVVTISAPAPQIEDGLALYLKLDETSGTTAADSTTNANNGTLVGFSSPDTSWVPGVLNNALQFNLGGDVLDVVQVPSSPFLDFGTDPGTNSFSLSLWVKGSADGQTNGAGLVCKGAFNRNEAYGIDYYAGPGYRFFARDSSRVVVQTTQSGVAPSGSWQHIAVSYDTASRRTRMYVDGVLRGTNSTFPVLFSNSDPVDVGARDNDASGLLPFQGALDDVRIYSRPITPIEVRALNYRGHPPTLAIAPAGATVTVSWPLEATTVYDLQTAPTLGGAWTNVVPIITNSVTVTPSQEALFYRLQRK